MKLVKQLPTSWPCERSRALIFFDTTSTYFETEGAEEPVWRDPHGRVLDSGENGGENGGEDESGPDGAAAKVRFRTHGGSKDSRDDLPQVIVGMAVTRDGIPVRV